MHVDAPLGLGWAWLHPPFLHRSLLFLAPSAVAAAASSGGSAAASRLLSVAPAASSCW